MSSKPSLTIVCCHAVYTGSARDDPYDDANWILKPFQRGDPATGKSGEHSTFIEHLRHGVSLWQQDPRGILVLSGAATEQSRCNVSEARGYFNVLERLMPQIANKERIILEESATDSYQNMLFSILEYHKRCAFWPDSFSVVTHAFKRYRIMDLHARAIKWPLSRIDFQGTDPPFAKAEAEDVERSEQKCCEDWQRDLYGVRSPLRLKRIERGLDEAATLQLHEDGDVRGLLAWDGGCAPSEVYLDELPWEKLFEKSVS